MRECRRGPSPVEILLMLLVLGLVAIMLTGGFSGLLPLGRETVAVTKAREVNGARWIYALVVPDAATRWAAVTADTLPPQRHTTWTFPSACCASS
jgi:hypothetical protein